MIKNVSVYCSSSDSVDPAYADAAQQLGRYIGEAGHTLVYGGGNAGLMGSLARAVHTANGRVVGVIPDGWQDIDGAAYEAADQLIPTRTLQKRRAVMFSRADAFAVLPGGFGTMEEFLEVVSLKQHQRHDKPIVVVNTLQFFDPLLVFFDHLFENGFAHSKACDLFHVAATPEEAFQQLNMTSSS